MNRKQYKPAKITVWVLLFVDVYILTFFLFSVPLPDMHYRKGFFTVQMNQTHFSSTGTMVCISHCNFINIAAYYFYYPVHKPLEVKGFIYVHQEEPSTGSLGKQE